METLEQDCDPAKLAKYGTNLTDLAKYGTNLVSKSIPIVTQEDIKQVVTSTTGIPLEKLTLEDSRNLLKMEKTINGYVIGQEKAVKVVVCAVRRARLGIGDPNRPIATFLFTGPTGVGKTELANVLAIEYFGSKKAMVRLDMNEFYDRQSQN